MEEEPSPLTLAQIWAYHALLGHSSPTRLVRLGHMLFRQGGWRQVEKDVGVVEALSSCLKVLRDPWRSTEERCRAIGQMAGVLRNTPYWTEIPYWVQIENILYQHQLYWPLLVLDGTEAWTLPEGSTSIAALAVSLPVAVDVSFDGRGGVHLKGTRGIVLADKWKEHLAVAARVGKELWRAKHGNHGSFREDVLRTSVTFDFSVAQEVGRDLAQRGIESITLDDGSADAYFAQVVLHRLLGRTSTLMSAGTGLIGKRCRNEDDTPALNYRFMPPGGIPDKLRYVFACRTFERVVLPKAEESEAIVQKLLTADVPDASAGQEPPARRGMVNRAVDQTAEVLFAYDLHTLADTMQVRGWRQFQYARCPEVAWAVHNAREGRPGLLDYEDTRVQHVIRMLNGNSSPIVRCNTSPIVVASALWHINSYQRKVMDPHMPPSLSWAFIRPLDREQDTQFWELVWKVMGASPEDFYAFIQHASMEEAIDRLASALNKFEPDLYCPSHRGPDILVLVGTQRFEDSRERTLNPRSRPFMVASILEELLRSGRLRGPHDHRLWPLIGKTRIVLLPADEPIVVGGEVHLNRLHPREVSFLRALATFEGGFTQHTARLMLTEFGDYRGAEVRYKILEPLVRKGILREGQGWYHIPRHLLKSLRAEEGPEKLAQRHYRAGCALAPYVTEVEIPSLALDAAFSPEYTPEAAEHLWLAIQYARPAGDQKLRQASRKALQHLTRFALIPSWGLVNGFLQVGLSRDAYEMAADLLAWQHASQVESHPSQLLLAARAAALRAKDFGEGSNNPERGRQLRQEANRYFREALDHCTYFPSEEGFNRLHLLTAYAVYLSEQEPEREEDLNHLSRQAIDLLVQGVTPRSVEGQWFELMGDREPSHANASNLYQWGTEAISEWAQLWIKGIGAASLAGLSEQVDRFRNALSADKGVDLLAKSRGAYQRQRKKSPVHVVLRWEEAFRLFDRFWGI